MAKDIKDYIKEVDLVVFMAKHYGFKLDEEKMGKTGKAVSASSITMKNEEGERVVVGRDTNGMYFYKEVHENTRIVQDKKTAELMKGTHFADKGDIFKFLQYRHNKSMYQLARGLDRYIRQTKNEDLEKYRDSIGYGEVIKSERSESNIAVKAELLKNISGEKIDTAYLESRGLDKQTILNPKFNNKIFTGVYDDQARAERVKNTIFPLFNEKGENVGLERRNNSSYHDKKIRGHKSEGLWISDFNKERPVDGVYIGESPIDVMSYHEMKADKMANNIYLATMGSMSQTQLDLVNKFVDYYKPKHLGTLTDNDVQGYRYDLKVLDAIGPESSLSNKEYASKNVEFSNAQFHMNSSKGKAFAEFGIRLNANDTNHSMQLAGKLLQKVEEINSKIKLVPGEPKPFSFTPKFLDDNSVSGVVRFSNNTFNWSKMVGLAHDLKHGLSEKMSFQKSFFTDFNRDLQVSKGMGKLLNNVEKNTVEMSSEKFNIPADFLQRSKKSNTNKNATQSSDMNVEMGA